MIPSDDMIDIYARFILIYSQTVLHLTRFTAIISGRIKLGRFPIIHYGFSFKWREGIIFFSAFSPFFVKRG